MGKELDNAKVNMQKAIDALKKEFAQHSAGRANPAILDNVTVDYYGQPTPISQVAAIKVPEASVIAIEPWEKSIANAIEKAILAANIGVTPNNDGKGVIRLPFPAPTEERRKEIVKECKGIAENTRVSIRNSRRDCKNKLAQLQKDGEIGEDVQHSEEKKLQDLTDEFVAKVDELLKEKEAQVLEI
ncbi:MAG: ribosome recycling factor [Coriobacteriales bacterium]|nr:ribosome recycling factor [Coriobacteriales bacterium]